MAAELVEISETADIVKFRQKRHGCQSANPRHGLKQTDVLPVLLRVGKGTDPTGNISGDSRQSFISHTNRYFQEVESSVYFPPMTETGTFLNNCAVDLLTRSVAISAEVVTSYK